MKTEVYGEIKDYVVKVEFQQRGTPHIHVFLWNKNPKIYGVHPDSEVTEFIDKYIFCSIPNEDDDKELHDLVTSCQTHRCLKTKCKKKGKTSCKYNFPRLPSNATIIS